jgi:hypothetical protein
VEVVERLGALAETGRQHQLDAGRQGAEGLLGQLAGELDLDGCQGRLGVDQFEHRAGGLDLRGGNASQHHALDGLLAERDEHQVPRLEGVLQLGRGMVMETPSHLSDVDGDFEEDGHRK